MMIKLTLNTLRPRQNGRHFADDIFKRIFLNENILIPIEISLKFVPKGPINNIPALVQIMAWRRPGDKPLSEPMMVNLTTHICVTRPQWVNMLNCFKDYQRCIYISYGMLDFVQQKKTKFRTLHVAYPILSISCLLMPWWLKSPGHQQALYWLNKPEYSISSNRRVSISSDNGLLPDGIKPLPEPGNHFIRKRAAFQSKLAFTLIPVCRKLVHYSIS